MEATLEIRMGEDTEELLNAIFNGLEDEDADSVELERMSETNDVAREPITTMAVLTFSATVLHKLVPLIDRYLETRRQSKALDLLYKAAQENPGAVEALKELSLKHADVAVHFRPITVPS